MIKNKTKLILGLICLIIGGVGATLEISTQWHYFGNGLLFGIGLGLVVSGIKSRKTVGN